MKYIDSIITQKNYTKIFGVWATAKVMSSPIPKNSRFKKIKVKKINSKLEVAKNLRVETNKFNLKFQ